MARIWNPNYGEGGGWEEVGDQAFAAQMRALGYDYQPNFYGTGQHALLDLSGKGPPANLPPDTRYLGPQEAQQVLSRAEAEANTGLSNKVGNFIGASIPAVLTAAGVGAAGGGLSSLMEMLGGDGVTASSASGVAPTQVGGVAYDVPNFGLDTPFQNVNGTWGTAGTTGAGWTAPADFFAAPGLDTSFQNPDGSWGTPGTTGAGGAPSWYLPPGLDNSFQNPDGTWGTPGTTGADAPAINWGAAGNVTPAAAALAKMLGIEPETAALLGPLLGAGLGIFGSSQQANSLEELARTSRDALASAEASRRADIEFGRSVGQPSRDRYEASYAPGFDITAEPALKTAMDQSYDTLLRRLSATGGNPFGNPGGLIEAQKSVMGGVALPYLQDYRKTNAATGGLANFGASGATVGTPATAGPNQFDLAGTQARGGAWQSLGSGVADIFTPKSDLATLLKQLGGRNAFA